MKLAHCPACGDVFNVEPEVIKHCKCNAARAKRVTAAGHEIEASAATVLIGIPNEAFAGAVKGRLPRGRGVFFGAYVLPRECTTVKIVS